MKLNIVRFRIPILIVTLITAYVFAALELTADELYGTALDKGPYALYYFPILGPWHMWDSWVLVFTGIGLGFFAAWILGYLYKASTQQRIQEEKRIIIRFPDFPLTNTEYAWDPESPASEPTASTPPATVANVPRGTSKSQPQSSLSLEDL